jgi:ribonuclease R
VADPGAKNAAEGDKVVVEMLRFPTHFHPGEGVIVEVLGARGAPGVDTRSIIREFNLPEHFPLDVMDNARAQAAAFDESIGQRLDLTGETIITIDPQDARDFDDAISLERLENGHWRLGVHIADVAHFVPAGSLLDIEARERATSVYLPDRVIPMLPELISNGLASLQPDKLRYAKSVFIELTADGARVATEFYNSAIISKRRFAYEEVDDYLADPNRWKAKLTGGVFALLGRMHELAMILRQRRLDGGAIELTLPEIKIDLDKKGRVSGAHVVQNTVSHQIIEEFMLAANEAVAEYLNDQGLNFLRRVHEPPDPRKQQALTEFVRESGHRVRQLGQPLRDQTGGRAGAQRPAPARRPFRRAAEHAKGGLLARRRGPLRPEQPPLLPLHLAHPPLPGLWSSTACSTMLANGERPADDFDHLAVIGGHCSDREQRAEAAERELIKVKLLTFLSNRIGEQMEAVITGVEEFGLFTQGIELPAEGLIRTETLGRRLLPLRPQPPIR